MKKSRIAASRSSAEAKFLLRELSQCDSALARKGGAATQRPVGGDRDHLESVLDKVAEIGALAGNANPSFSWILNPVGSGLAHDLTDDQRAARHVVLDPRPAPSPAPC